MATFTGTKEELHRHLGSRFTRLVQQITYKQKRTTACQHCASFENLESAHIQGRSRPEILNSMAIQYTNKLGVMSFNFAEFEKEFIAEHVPIEKTILILCRTCHQRYDKATSRPVNQNKPSTNAAVNSKIVLPITLDPTHVQDFKRNLLQSKSAEIEILYTDGRTRIKKWKATRFTEDANVMGNIRSRPEFKQGTWQASGIAAVHVKSPAPESHAPQRQWL